MMSRPAWKPHCDLEYISLLTCFMIRFKINIAKILPAMERREIPQLLSHTFLFPLFLYKWWIRTSLKSCGTIPCFQISMNNSSNFFTSFVPLYLKISDGNTSFPGAFQDIICSIAARTSWKFDKNDNSSISGCWFKNIFINRRCIVENSMFLPSFQDFSLVCQQVSISLWYSIFLWTKRFLHTFIECFEVFSIESFLEIGSLLRLPSFFCPVSTKNLL